MTEFLDVPGGRLAYDVDGSGTLGGPAVIVGHSLFLKTFKSTPAHAEAQLSNVSCPALVIMGTLDPDFADPQAEGNAILAAMPAGADTAAMAGGAGHYPHAQTPEAVAELVIPFLKEHAGA